MEQPAVSGVILAGGHSSRMGFNKALASLGDGKSLIAQTVAIVRQLSSDLLIVANDAQAYAGLDIPVVPDAYPGTGALGGLYSGLLAAHREHSLVVACDMPFLNVALWRHMLSLPRDYDVLLPRLAGLDEPLHAIYAKRCLAVIEEHLKQRQLRIGAFLPAVNVRHLDEAEVDEFDPTHLSFWNVNTPEELARARQLWIGSRFFPPLPKRKRRRLPSK